MTTLVEQLYLPLTRKARHRIFETIGADLVDSSINPHEMELFLIRFSASGVRMTEPVESWIRRAGERCKAVGLDRLGRVLQIHAGQEADHHLMMIEDTRILVER